MALAVAQATTNVVGNNANAYLDADANNVPDSGGTNAQAAGAVGVIVGNNIAGDGTFAMGGFDGSIKIPSVMMSFESRNALVGQLPLTRTIRLRAVPPIQIDVDLDSDIVVHEYGHGLPWRTIGGMSGQPARSARAAATRSRC